MAEMNDRERLAAAQLEKLFHAHREAVAAYVRRRAPSGTADDIVAETFLVAWRRIDRVPVDALPWLLAVARNVLLTQRRGANRRSALRARLVGLSEAAGGELEVERRAGPVAAALARLSETDREAITLIAWDGLTPAEAAVVLGQSGGSFRVRLHRAKQRLRRELDRDPASSADPVSPTHPLAKEMNP